MAMRRVFIITMMKLKLLDRFIFIALFSAFLFLLVGGLYLIFIPSASQRALVQASQSGVYAHRMALAHDPYNERFWMAELYAAKRDAVSVDQLYHVSSLVRVMHQMSDSDYMKLQRHLHMIEEKGGQ